MAWRIVSVDPQGDDALALLREAAVEARALYPELHAPDAPWPTNPPLADRGAYVIAYDDAHPVACGALRPVEAGTAEVRRMYVLKEARRAGVATAVLDHLTALALELGYGRLVLETGFRQAPAMRLYEARGFTRIPPFGEHVGDPTSVCYERQLDDRRQE